MCHKYEWMKWRQLWASAHFNYNSKLINNIKYKTQCIPINLLKIHRNNINFAQSRWLFQMFWLGGGGRGCWANGSTAFETWQMPAHNKTDKIIQSIWFTIVVEKSFCSVGLPPPHQTKRPAKKWIDSFGSESRNFSGLITRFTCYLGDILKRWAQVRAIFANNWIIMESCNQQNLSVKWNG